MAPRPPTSQQRVSETYEAVARFRNTMPTPCSRCKNANPPKQCLVDVRSGRCKSCSDSHVKCDLRVTFKEFEKLAATRTRLSKEADVAEDELEDAEKKAARLISEAHELVAKARSKARRKRKELRQAESKEDGSYQRELANIEEVQRMENPVVSTSDVPAGSDFLDFSILEDFNVDALQVSPSVWGHMTGNFFPEDPAVAPGWVPIASGGDTSEPGLSK